MSPTISKDVWITREGHEMDIRDMASSHLLSTIHFIERNRFNNLFSLYEGNRLMEAGYYMEWPIQYESLVAEAVKRGILKRPTDTTGLRRNEVRVSGPRQIGGRNGTELAKK